MGFGSILLIALILGGIAVVNMRGVRTSAVLIQKENVPEVAVANNVERWSLHTMYGRRGYPILRLADHFAASEQSGDITWPAEVAIAIVQTDGQRVGVAVDRFVSYVEVIVKPMGRDFANISAFQGATILGDGRVALVINPAGFV